MLGLFIIYGNNEPRLLFIDILKWKKRDFYSWTEGVTDKTQIRMTNHPYIFIYLYIILENATTILEE